MNNRDAFERLYNSFEVTRSDDYARLTGEEFGKKLARDAIRKIDEKVNLKFIDSKPNRNYNPYNQSPDMRACFPEAGAK